MLHATKAFLWLDAGADINLPGEGIEQFVLVDNPSQPTEYAGGCYATLMLCDAQFHGL